MVSKKKRRTFDFIQFQLILKCGLARTKTEIFDFRTDKRDDINYNFVIKIRAKNTYETFYLF